MLGDLRAGGDGAAFAGIDLSGLVGRTVGYAAQEIARALAPENEDAERICVAIHEAIAEVLPDVEIFDPAAMSPDQVIAVLVDFLGQVRSMVGDHRGGAAVGPGELCVDEGMRRT